MSATTLVTTALADLGLNPATEVIDGVTRWADFETAPKNDECGRYVMIYCGSTATAEKIDAEFDRLSERLRADLLDLRCATHKGKRVVFWAYLR